MYQIYPCGGWERYPSQLFIKETVVEFEETKEFALSVVCIEQLQGDSCQRTEKTQVSTT